MKLKNVSVLRDFALEDAIEDSIATSRTSTIGDVSQEYAVKLKIVSSFYIIRESIFRNKGEE